MSDWSLLEEGPRGAPAVLLLPGALGRAETSFEYVAALRIDFHVLAPSYPRRAVPNMDDLADGAAALLDSSGVGRAHVVGGSFGGLVAQALAVRHPARVASLLLSDTWGPTPARAPLLRSASGLLRVSPERGVRAVLRAGVRRYLRDLPPEPRCFWSAHFAEMLASLTRAEAAGRASAWADFDARYAALPAPACETLVLRAESDHTLSPTPLLRRLPYAQLHTVRSPLGHAASVGDAPAYIGPIRSFLREAARC